MSYVPAEKAADTKIEWGEATISGGFAALEQVLAESSGKYCVGDEPSLADVYLVPMVFNANRWKVDMSKFPTISRINAALEELPAFQAAHPNKQPDANPQ
jgi:maleylacetoacetate isomerase